MTSNLSVRPSIVNSPLLQRLARLMLVLMGWQVEGLELLPQSKYVTIVAPHTSNWDLFVGLVGAHALGLFANWPIRYMVKESATRWPIIGQVIRFFGGIPIRRHAAQDVVDHMVEVLGNTQRMLLVITPEGTRQRRDYWKTGFYRIALKAQVPIALAYLDYQRKSAGIGQVVIPTGDMEADFAIFRQFYSGIGAKFPEEFGPVDFKRDATG